MEEVEDDDGLVESEISRIVLELTQKKLFGAEFLTISGSRAAIEDDNQDLEYLNPIVPKQDLIAGQDYEGYDFQEIYNLSDPILQWLPDWLFPNRVEDARFINWMNSKSGYGSSQATIRNGAVVHPGKYDNEENSFNIMVRNRFNLSITDRHKSVILGARKANKSRDATLELRVHQFLYISDVVLILLLGAFYSFRTGVKWYNHFTFNQARYRHMMVTSTDTSKTSGKKGSHDCEDMNQTFEEKSIRQTIPSKLYRLYSTSSAKPYDSLSSKPALPSFLAKVFAHRARRHRIIVIPSDESSSGDDDSVVHQGYHHRKHDVKRHPHQHPGDYRLPYKSSSDGQYSFPRSRLFRPPQLGHASYRRRSSAILSVPYFPWYTHVIPPRGDTLGAVKTSKENRVWELDPHPNYEPKDRQRMGTTSHNKGIVRNPFKQGRIRRSWRSSDVGASTGKPLSDTSHSTSSGSVASQSSAMSCSNGTQRRSNQ